MCGIGVALDTEGRGRANRWALPLMRHRGPDDAGVLGDDEGSVDLEHCRLSIIDPDNPEAAQPFSDSTGRWVIVYNGELFNFREMRLELERLGVGFRTNSDTEVALQSFIAYGSDAFRRFVGMFALVVWDRSTGELVAARDQIGVKPLYYAHFDGLFVAASELRTLLGHPSVTPKLDASAVVEYLGYGHVSGDRTLVESVRKLRPGHVLRLRDGAIATNEYWDPLPPKGPPVTDHLEDNLFQLLDEAVAASVVSDVPISLMLSGGLDSSTVAMLAARHVKPSELTAYSVSFGLPTDEAGTAARLAADIGIRHRELLLTEDVLRATFDAWLENVDVPSADPTWIAISHIAQAVNEDGIKVLLSGDGGDELFGGYDRWMKYLRFHDAVWRRTPTSLRKIGGTLARPIFKGFAGDIARRASVGGELFVGSRSFHDDDLRRYLGPVGIEAAARRAPDSSVESLHDEFQHRFPEGDYLARMAYVGLKTHLVEDYLARLDKLGMSHSVEGRVPLLDPRIAGWAFRVPQEDMVPGFEQKALFRRTVRRLLPDYVVDRPKQGFCPPVSEWAESLLAERLNGASILSDAGLVTPDCADRLGADRSVRGSSALWTLGTLEAWCARHITA
jgi:asparagine synthase (glutamine-hydrolysing)